MSKGASAKATTKAGAKKNPKKGEKKKAARLDPALLRLAGVLIIGVLAPLLDSTIVNVALRTLGGALDAPVATVQWVSTGYLLALAMSIPLTGWAVDRFGAKRMWLAALLLFLVGSVCCGLAWNMGALIAFRVLQGIGGGLLMPIMQTLLMRAAGAGTIGRLLALVTLPALVGPIFGPTIGGLIVDHLSWRWIFYVNVPLCLVAMVLAWRVLPGDAPLYGRRLDLPGLLLISPALAGLVYGLTKVGDDGRIDRPEALVPLVGGVLLLVGFVIRALRVDAPLINLGLFRTRSFNASSVLLFLSGLSMFGAMLLLPLYYQQQLGHGAQVAGLLLAFHGLGSLLVRRFGGLIDAIGPRPVVLVGAVMVTLSTVPFALGGAYANGVLLAVALVVRGAGLSAVNLAVTVAAYHDLTPAQIPDASSTTRIVQQIGGSFGVAMFAVVLQRQFAAHPGPAGRATAYGHTFTWAVVFAAVSVLPALLLPGLTGRQGDDGADTDESDGADGADAEGGVPPGGVAAGAELST